MKAHDLVGCCKLRTKILLAPAVLEEEECGVPDSELADVMVFEKSPHGRPMITFRFCPWCGKPWERTGKTIERNPAPEVQVVPADAGESAPNPEDVIRQVWFVRAGDPQGRNHAVVVRAIGEILGWLERGLGFDVVLEKQEDARG